MSNWNDLPPLTLASALQTFATPAQVVNAVNALAETTQPLDGDLSAIAALGGTGFAKRTGSNTWTVASLVAADIPASSLSIATSQLTGLLLAVQFPALTGDVTTPGGSLATTVASVGGSTAANVHSAELLANAATSALTASTIVKRDAQNNTRLNVVQQNARLSSVSATPLVLDNTSAHWQTFLGSAVSSYPIQLPDATTIVRGHSIVLHNATDACNIPVSDGLGGLQITLAPGQMIEFFLLGTTGTADGLWDWIDYTGSGMFVLATSPTLITPTIADLTNMNHDHSGAAGGGKLAQANTHQSPDTDSATTALHHTLGTGANQAAAGNHTHTGKTLISGSSAGISGGATRFVSPTQQTSQSNELNARMVVPYACTVKNFYVQTNSTQGAGGSYVVTVRIAGSSTSIVVTIAAGATLNLFSDLTHSAPLTAGQTIDLQLVNGDPSNTSAVLVSWSLELDQVVS